MQTGTVDVRTRDTERHGKMRVDQLADHLDSLKPAPSSSHNNFYKNAWNPENYKDIPLPSQEKEAKKEEPAKVEKPAKV